LAAKDFKRKGEDSIFAFTPPLEAPRSILMMVATPSSWAPGWICLEGPHRIQISFADISRAYFHARIGDDNKLYVELPSEDEDFGSDMCGRLNVHIYGTRHAAEGWHSKYVGSLHEFGFIIGASSACVFYSPSGHLVFSVHGDDFTTVGPKSALDNFVFKFKTKYELKEAARLGAGEGDAKEARVLNRTVRRTSEGFE